MNKHIFWAVPVGVAAGLSLPFLLPTPKVTKPTATPSAPMVKVEGFALGKRRIAKPYEETASDASAAAMVTSQPTGHAELVVAPGEKERSRVEHHRRKQRPARKLDSATLRRLQLEDSRAWDAANRMLMYERRGA